MKTKNLSIFRGLLPLFWLEASCFLSPDSISRPINTVLHGAFNRRNKQGDLMKKMEEARRQREMVEGNESSDLIDDTKSKASRKSNEDIKRENDRRRFDQLLNSESATINYDLDGNLLNYMTKQQEEEEIDAGFRGMDRLFEGDPAKTSPFEDLVRIENENALGEAGVKRLIPWLNKSSAKHLDYLVILSDPRPKSSELRSSMKYLVNLPPEIRSRLIIVNADTPAENRRYLKKQGINDITVFCDEKREWMREYTALGEKRWAMCMFVVADSRVQKLVREVDVDSVAKVIQNAVRSMNI